jgi:hypothetical protein
MLVVSETLQVPIAKYTNISKEMSSVEGSILNRVGSRAMHYRGRIWDECKEIFSECRFCTSHRMFQCLIFLEGFWGIHGIYSLQQAKVYCAMLTKVPKRCRVVEIC